MKARMSRLGWSIVFGIGALVLASVSHGQTSERFEVAVIRPSEIAGDSGLQLFEGGRLLVTNEPVQLLIRIAFRLQDAQISSGPSWVASDRYDVEAKTGRPERIRPVEMSPLMQSLLADRFSLKFHWETRTIDVLTLRTDKGELRVKPKAAGEVNSMNSSTEPRGSRLIATATSLTLLAGYIGNRLGKIVLDKTELGDEYNFTLEWGSDDTTDPSVPSLPTALREQLGLRLQSERAPMPVLVIDSVARPSDN